MMLRPGCGRAAHQTILNARQRVTLVGVRRQGKHIAALPQPLRHLDEVHAALLSSTKARVASGV